jgi:diaminopimelate epimerase
VRFSKGHGTGNDFVILPDPDGQLVLTHELVAAVCDRRRGIGGDGVLRVVRTAAAGLARGSDAEWFMDYRNADGSIAEMCGNGVRVYARYLIREGWARPGVFALATRAGDRIVTVPDDATGDIAVEMGPPVVDQSGAAKVTVAGRTYAGDVISMGNPHVVVAVDSLNEAGPLRDAPGLDDERLPTGANVEFVVREGPYHLSMRVHERGSGETLSCGTGACAAVVAASGTPGNPWVVDVPGGRLTVTWRPDTVVLAGPAVLVADGELHLDELLP